MKITSRVVLGSIVGIAVVLSLPGCSGNSTETAAPESTTQATTGPNNDKTTTTEDPGARQQAYAYAFDLAGTHLGSFGCSSVHGERERRCIYSAAFAGCYKGAGGADRPIPYKQEFPEPELRRVYEQSIADCEGDDEVTTSTSLPVAVPAGEVIRGSPYMGIACSARDALSCDRVGLSVRLTEPAHRVTATLGGRQFTLDDPAYSARLRNGESSRFAGYLHPAGLREPGPLHVLGHRRPGRDRWLDSAPNKFPVTLTIERKNGTTQMTKIDVWLAPGWG